MIALLGAAVLGPHRVHPRLGQVDREEAVERMVAARTYARRGPASAELLAWLDAVEAECETRCGHVRTALHLIGHAETVLDTGAASTTARSGWTGSAPSGSPRSRGTRSSRRVICRRRARRSSSVLDALGPPDEKQVTVILGDLAAVEAAAGDPEAACGYAVRALEQLERTWYATGMDRVREVRRDAGAAPARAVCA
jgi:hypothetical protein